MRALWTTKTIPKFVPFDDAPSYGLTNIPYLSWLTDYTIDEMPLLYVIIQMNDPSDHATIDELA